MRKGGRREERGSEEKDGGDITRRRIDELHTLTF